MKFDGNAELMPLKFGRVKSLRTSQQIKSSLSLLMRKNANIENER